MTELEQKLLAENEQLHRELDELKQKLEVETSPRVEYVDEKTRRFRGMLYRKHESTGYYMKTTSLHVDVYKFYHGLDEIPRNCLIHHDGKDEHGNYDSSAKFLEVGYKDGGKLFGMINLSSDVLLVKDNRRLYRLNGEYPNWSLNEVSRNVEVRSRLEFKRCPKIQCSDICRRSIKFGAWLAKMF